MSAIAPASPHDVQSPPIFAAKSDDVARSAVGRADEPLGRAPAASVGLGRPGGVDHRRSALAVPTRIQRSFRGDAPDRRGHLDRRRARRYFDRVASSCAATDDRHDLDGLRGVESVAPALGRDVVARLAGSGSARLSEQQSMDVARRLRAGWLVTGGLSVAPNGYVLDLTVRNVGDVSQSEGFTILASNPVELGREAATRVATIWRPDRGARPDTPASRRRTPTHTGISPKA